MNLMSLLFPGPLRRSKIFKVGLRGEERVLSCKSNSFFNACEIRNENAGAYGSNDHDGEHVRE